MTPKQIKEIIDSIPQECNPRLGGSCSLYFRGIVDSYRDIDIIIDKNTIDKVNLQFPKIESLHGEGLNKRVKYCINGREVDILESICPIAKLEMSLIGIYFESVDNVLLAKNQIKEYLQSLKLTSKRVIKNKGRADSLLILKRVLAEMLTPYFFLNNVVEIVSMSYILLSSITSKSIILEYYSVITIIPFKIAFKIR